MMSRKEIHGTGSNRAHSPAYPPSYTTHIPQHSHISTTPHNPAAGTAVDYASGSATASSSYDIQSAQNPRQGTTSAAAASASEHELRHAQYPEPAYITEHLRHQQHLLQQRATAASSRPGASSPRSFNHHHHHHRPSPVQVQYDSEDIVNQENQLSFGRSMQEVHMREGREERMELHPPYRAAGTPGVYNNDYNGQRQSESTNSGPGFCAIVLWLLSWVLVLATLPFSLCICFKVVQEYERAVIFRLGRLDPGSKGPGIFFVLPCIENYTKVDMRSTLFDIPPQEILTKDSVTVSVDAVVYYRIFNANLSVANVENVHHSTRLLAQTTLRNVLGTKALHDLLGDREIISNTVQVSLDESTEAWGIKVERVEVKDVRLPVQLQRAMAAEAEAAREARAKVIAAEGEQKAARALKEAADIIAESPGALQLRYLQTLNTISAEKNSTIIFPIPMDLITQFLHR
ncbi:band 7 protein AGAP004871-like [Paramacrobiotus metropolitanus]|nr:band 7 protein AGAP004871-like [Paramacrobiotus metropolitanus]